MPISISGAGPITGITSLNSTVDSTELGYLDGVSSALQTQINTKANDSSQGLYLITPTSIANSGGSASASGGTVTFTGVSSISLNGCFSSSYTNYRLVLSIDSSSTPQQPIIRLRVGGVDNSSSNYMSNGVDFSSSSSTSSGAYRTAGLMTSFYGHPQTSGYAFTVSDILNPFATARTAVLGMMVVQDSTDMRASGIQGMMNVTTSYDGFSLITASGTTTGTIRVYGYKN